MITASTHAIILSLLLVPGFVFIADGETPANLIFRETALDALRRVPPEAELIRVNETGTVATCQIRHDGHEFLLINGHEGPAFDWIDYPNFGTDGQHVHYIGNRGGKWMSNHRNPPVEGGQWFEVIDNRDPVVISDFTDARGEDTHLDAFKTISSDGTKTATVSQGPGKWFVIVNGKKEKDLDWLVWPVFSPDGKRLAYEASANDAKQYNDHAFVVVDGTDSPRYGEIERDRQHGTTIRFSPDSRHIVFAAQRSGTQSDIGWGRTNYIVLDGQELERLKYEYDAPSPIFSADNRWLIYGESKGLHINSVVVRSLSDGNKTQSRSYEQLWMPLNQTDGIVYFFALREQTIFRVEVTAAE